MDIYYYLAEERFKTYRTYFSNSCLCDHKQLRLGSLLTHAVTQHKGPITSVSRLYEIFALFALCLKSLGSKIQLKVLILKGRQMHFTQ